MLIAILVLTAPFAMVGMWFAIKVFAIAYSQVKLSKAISANDTEAVKAYFEDLAKRHSREV